MNAKKAVSYRLNVENLEERSLLAAGVTASLTNGLLKIEGSDASDGIGVFQYQDRLYLLGTDATYEASQVKAIAIDAKGGDDVIMLNPESFGGQRIDKLCVVNAGIGNDTVFGSAGTDIVLGGSGIDLIFGSDGNDVLMGGTETDFIFGGNGNDVLDGGAGYDWLVGEAGTNYLLDDPLIGAYRSGGFTRDKHLEQMTQQELTEVFGILVQPAQTPQPAVTWNSQGQVQVGGITVTPNTAAAMMGIPGFTLSAQDRALLEQWGILPKTN